MIVDDHGLVCLTEKEVCNLLYQNPKLNIEHFTVESATQFNNSIRKLHAGVDKIKQYVPLTISVEEFDQQCQNDWYMPEQYIDFDIRSWLIQQCVDQISLDRVNLELDLFEKTNLLMLVKYLKYLVDTMTKEGIVWGVGRGSSTASYVLYLIGLHLVDPIKYNIPIEEFFKKENENA